MSAVLSADFPRIASIAKRMAYEPRDFPRSTATPSLPLSIPEEVLDYYAFVFCQFGFGKMNITFEQFLLVASAVRSSGLNAEYE